MNESFLIARDLIEEAMQFAYVSETSELHEAICRYSFEKALCILYNTNFEYADKLTWLKQPLQHLSLMTILLKNG